jgi:hypothetical protein
MDARMRVVVLSAMAMVLFMLIVNRLLLHFYLDSGPFFCPETAEIA